MLSRKNAHRITRQETMMEMFEANPKKYFSYSMLCANLCMMRDFRDIVKSLIDGGNIKKVKTGYRFVKSMEKEK